MAEGHRTPGVYIKEVSAFLDMVAEVPTAVPAFLGYTEKAARGETDLTNVPTRIGSLVEFEKHFGGPPPTKIEFSLSLEDDGTPKFEPVTNPRFLLYNGMRLFFDNGGGPCWIVSTGGYVDKEGNPLEKTVAHFWAGLEALKKEKEPAMLVAPDAVLLSVDGWAALGNACLNHCAEMQNRITILDVYDGDTARDHTDDNDVISGRNRGIRKRIEADELSYGVAYYPWLDTRFLDSGDISYRSLDPDSRAILAQHVHYHWKTEPGLDKPGEKERKSLLDQLTKTPPKGTTGTAAVQDAAEVRRAHNELLGASLAYRSVMKSLPPVMTSLLEAMNVMPPAAAMAGVFARVDGERGVFEAPANTVISSAISTAVPISHEEHEELYVPLDGKAVNTIRAFRDEGMLVWGARTLDGNSPDWRYVNVRRTMIMLEQSIKQALNVFVFQANNASTWTNVKGMIGNFLAAQWKVGALAGATPTDAYDVSVGLGSTMTETDILDGIMRVTVKVAVTRPAEFIVITFSQKMQTSWPHKSWERQPM